MSAPTFSVTDNVQAARSPQEAILVLAQGLDAVLELLRSYQQVTDAWNSPRVWVDSVWGDGPEGKSTPDELQGLKNIADSAHDEARRRELTAIAEGDDPEAAAAARRLLNDTGGELNAVKDSAVKATVTEDDITVEAPEVTTEQKHERWEFAEKVLHLHENFKELGEDALSSYSVAGPMWLYLSSKEGRDFILSLPTDMKRAMIADVARFSQSDAYDMGRDILKVASPGTPEITYETMLAGRPDVG